MEILKYPDPRLTAPNALIETFGPEERAKVAEMFQVMANGDGVGLAAPQVGWNVRLFILQLPEIADVKAVATRMISFIFINPVVELLGERVCAPEGCLSFPGIYAAVERSSKIRVVAQTPSGRIDVVTEGFPAQAIQHEADHLDGVLFTERMVASERARVEPVLQALRNARKD